MSYMKCSPISVRSACVSGHGISTVDNLDQTAGQAATVFLLAGNTDGAFGVHQARLLPDIAGGVG